jgi:hypothetical protein
MPASSMCPFRPLLVLALVAGMQKKIVQSHADLVFNGANTKMRPWESNSIVSVFLIQIENNVIARFVTILLMYVYIYMYMYIYV